MDLNEIGNLLETIAVHYPATLKNITDPDGGLSKRVCEEWLRLIGFLEYDEAISRLDAYLQSDDPRKPPMAVDFLKTKPRREPNYFRAPIKDRKWKIVKGRLFDEEDREYAINPKNELPFYWDDDGYACQGTEKYDFIRRGENETNNIRRQRNYD